ncbi:MAG: hypothetical protein ABSF34_18995, partial [Verrucomicrobiota bacterium]
VQGIETAMKTTILPLQARADTLAKTIEPTLKKLGEASESAAQLWPQRIWKTALTAGLVVGLSVAALGIGAMYWQMKRHFDQTLADEIRTEKFTLQHNKDAFQSCLCGGQVGFQFHLCLTERICLSVGDFRGGLQQLRRTLRLANGKIFVNEMCARFPVAGRGQQGFFKQLQGLLVHGESKLNRILPKSIPRV